MKIILTGNSKGRLKIQTDSNQEDSKVILYELKKTTRKLRRLFHKNGFEINLTLTSNSNLLEEEKSQSYHLR